MAWMQVPHGLRLDPIAKGPAEALVVLLHDAGDSATTPSVVAERWAPTVPTTAFIALDGIGPLDPYADLPSLNRTACALEGVLQQLLRDDRLDVSRLVLAGFGSGGALALFMLLRKGLGCAGVLALGATLLRPLSRIRGAGRKVRLIECAGEGRADPCSLSPCTLSNVVAWLTRRGIDTRGVQLVGSVRSDAAIRHGGAYLVELVATAQRGDRLPVGR